MRDINFFRSYQKNKAGGSIAVKRYGAAAIGLVFLMAVLSGYNYFRISHIKNHIKDMQAFMENPQNVAQYKNYLDETEKLTILTTYYDAVSKINKSIENSNHINTHTLDTLLSTMPEDIMLQNLSMNEKDMAFQGFSMSYTAIAEFEYNLRTSGLFTDVFVSNISRSSDALSLNSPDVYLFAVTCKVKGGDK